MQIKYVKYKDILMLKSSTQYLYYLDFSLEDLLSMSNFGILLLYFPVQGYSGKNPNV